MITRSITSLVLLGAVLCFGASTYTGGIKLRYGFQSQKQYKCRTALEVTTLEDASESTIPAGITVGLGLGITLTVEKTMGDDQLVCVLAVDSLAIQISAPDREKNVIPLEALKGKALRMMINRRGIARNISAPDTVSSRQALQSVGFDLYSRELLNRMIIFLEFPEKNLEFGESWSFSRIDTLVRNGQNMIAQRTTQCTLLADSTVMNRMFHRIAFSTVARLDGSMRPGDVVITMKGVTNGDGTLFLSLDGIPSRALAHIDSEMRLGSAKTVKQSGTVETTVE